LVAIEEKIKRRIKIKIRIKIKRRIKIKKYKKHTKAHIEKQGG